MNHTHVLSGSFPMVTDAAGINSGQAFLTGELERMEEELNKPLSRVTWQRDIPVITGGGYADFSSSTFVEYSNAGANQWGIVSGSANTIPIIQGNVTKDIWKTHNFMNMIRVPFLDEQRMAALSVRRSLTEIFEDGLQLNWNFSIQQSVYLGFPEFNTTGFLNNPNVVASLVPQNAGGTSRLWSAKTADEILKDINDLILGVFNASEQTEYPNQINLPTTAFSNIATRMVSQAADKSILKYVLENNIAALDGEPLVIVQCRQCNGIGLPLTTGGNNTNRMVAYRNDKRYLNFDMNVPLYRLYTAQDPTQVAYMSPYYGQFSEVKVKAPQVIAYRDGV